MPDKNKNEKTSFSVLRSSIRLHATHAIGELKKSRDVYVYCFPNSALYFKYIWAHDPRRISDAKKLL